MGESITPLSLTGAMAVIAWAGGCAVWIAGLVFHRRLQSYAAAAASASPAASRSS